MGGKKKDAQRTKGNVQPASSGRAAQLLEASGTQIGFVGFDSLSGDPGYLPLTLQQATLGAEECIDGELRMIMKRMTKRDAVTRLKALQAFQEICEQKEADIVQDVLQYWPRLYSRLAIDCDRRVREAAQNALKQLAVKSGRNLAPHLKQIIGAWVLSFCDNHAPAASSAKAAFQATFPSEAKQSDAFIHCSPHILKYLHEMLFTVKADTLSDPKTTAPEEMEEKYLRILSSSLLCLRLVLTTVSADKHKLLADQYGDILQQGTFWKFAKHENTAIRSAFFSLMSGVCHALPDLATEHASQICPSVLSSLAEADPIVCPSVWEAALCVVSYIPDYFNHVNLRKAMLPSLWLALRNGFNGNALSVCSMLLPFLSKLTQEVTGNPREFYQEFFRNFRAGLATDRIQTSPRSCNALVKVFIECLRFLINQAVIDGDVAFVEFLLEEQMFQVVKASLTDNAEVLANSCLYSLTSAFIVSLNTRVSDKEKSIRFREIYTCIRDICWEALKTICKSVISAETDYSVSRLLILLKCLINPEATQTKTKSVAFTSTTEASRQSLRVTVDHPDMERTTDLMALTCAYFVVQLEGGASKNASSLLGYTRELCHICSSSEFFACLSQHLGSSSLLHMIERFMDFITVDSSPSLLKDILIIVTSISQYIDEEQQLAVLLSLTQRIAVSHLHILVEVVLSHDWFGDVTFTWLNHALFRGQLISNMESLLQHIDRENIEGICHASHIFLTLLTSRSAKCGGLLCSISQICRHIILTVTSTTSDELLYQECILMRAAFKAFNCQSLDIDQSCLAQSLFAWLTSDSQLNIVCLISGQSIEGNETMPDATDSHELTRQIVLEVLKEALAYCNPFALLKPMQSCVTSASSLLQLRALSILYNQLAKSLPPDFLTSYIKDNLDLLEANLFKWMAIDTVKCQLLFDEYPKFVNFKPNELCIPAYIKHTVFIAVCSKVQELHLSQEHVWLHKATALGWVRSMRSSIPVELCNSNLLCEEVISLLSDCVAEEHTAESYLSLLSDDPLRISPLAVQQMASLLKASPPETTYSTIISKLSEYERLSHIDVTNINTLIGHVDANVLSELLDLLAARIISSDEVQMKITGTTGLLYLAATTVLKTENVNSEVVCGLLQYLLDAKARRADLFISQSIDQLVNTDHLSFNVAVMRFFGAAVKRCPTALSAKLWDFILCTLDNWFGDSNTILPADLSLVTSQLFVSNLASLLSVVADLMVTSVTRSPSSYPPDFLAEWIELHAQSIYTVLLPYFVNLAHQFTSVSTVQLGFVLSCISMSMAHCPAQHIKSHQLPIKLVPSATQSFPPDLETVINHLVPLVLSPSFSVQAAAYLLLSKIMPDLPQLDKHPVDESSEGRCPLETLVSVIDFCQGQLLPVVGKRIGIDSPLLVVPYSDEIHCLRGYFLTWKLLLKYLQYASIQQMAEYSSYLKQNTYVSDLLLILFNIIPVEKSLPEGQTFSNYVQLLLDGSCDNAELNSIACSLFYGLIKVLPALVRSWCSDLEKRANLLVDRFTAKYISPKLCMEEMELLQNSAAIISAENLAVKVRTVAREVIATYTLEEFSIELVLVLPSNYPIGTVAVECSKKLGVANTEWRAWMLQLTTLLTYQNGSVASAITLWKQSLDKKFEGVEECYICFSVLHGTNLQLPKQQCKTCKKKFHSVCLFKWFTSSQKSTCPLCRNLF